MIKDRKKHSIKDTMSLTIFEPCGSDLAQIPNFDVVYLYMFLGLFSDFGI